MKKREIIINNYILAYNQFDVKYIIADLDENIAFENIQNGEITMSLSGMLAFKHQAEQAKSYFSERKQTIKSYKHSDQYSEIQIDYKATLAMDFPNGLKKGQVLNLTGRSIFEFDNDIIVKLTDIS